MERLSFFLWIGFFIFSVVLVGLGFDVIAYSLIIMVSTGAQPPNLPLLDSPSLLKIFGSYPLILPLAFIGIGAICTLLALKWRQVGVDRYHFSELDSAVGEEEDEESPSSVLQALIIEVEESSGFERTEARAKAGTWLVDHVSALEEEDIALAKEHFGYLLPAEWGEGDTETAARSHRSHGTF